MLLLEHYVAVAVVVAVVRLIVAIESSVSWLLLSITEQIHCRFSVAVGRAVAGAIDNIIAVTELQLLLSLLL